MFSPEGLPHFLNILSSIFYLFSLSLKAKLIFSLNPVPVNLKLNFAGEFSVFSIENFVMIKNNSNLASRSAYRLPRQILGP